MLAPRHIIYRNMYGIYIWFQGYIKSIFMQHWHIPNHIHHMFNVRHTFTYFVLHKEISNKNHKKAVLIIY